MGTVMVREASADRPARRAAFEGQRQDCLPKRHCATQAARRRVGRPSRGDPWRCPLPPVQKPRPLSSLPSEARCCWPTSRPIESRSRWSSRNGRTATRRGPAVRALSNGSLLTVPASSEHAALHMWRRTHGGGRGRPQRGRGERGGADRERAAPLMGLALTHHIHVAAGFDPSPPLRLALLSNRGAPSAWEQ